MHLRFSLSYYKSHIREALCENIHHGVFFTVVTLRNYHEIRCASYFAIVPYVMGLRTRAEIIHTLCLPESAIAALSSVDVPRHASLLRLALTNSYFAFCTNNFCIVP